MKIDKVIMSSNNNPMYLDFWPSVSKIWKTKFGVEPILAFVDDSEDLYLSLDRTYGQVIKFDIIKDVPIDFQSLWVRYWVPKLFKDDVCIISDIDMYPISKWYFMEQIENIPRDHYVHLYPCHEEYGRLPSCYHIATGNLFSEILQLHDNWEDSVRSIPPGWYMDEIHATNLVFKWREQNFDRTHFLERREYKRVDRSGWHYDENLLKQEYYYDSHSIRPYKNYENEINKMLSFL